MTKTFLSRSQRTMTRRLCGALMITAMVASSGAAQDLSVPEDIADEPALQSELWAVLSGGSLKATIEGWARISGWTVVWDNPVDYRIRASATFQGAFEQAVAGLVDAIHQGSPELTVTLYRGNQVIHVEDAARLRN